MIGQNSHETQLGARANTVDEKAALNDANNSFQVNSSQLKTHTLATNIVNKVRKEVDNLRALIERRLQDAVLIAIENLVIARLALAKRSVNASSGRGVVNVVLDTDQGDFSGKIEGLRVNGSNRIYWHTKLNRIDETFGHFIAEWGDLMFNERNFDRQTRTHHRNLAEYLEKNRFLDS